MKENLKNEFEALKKAVIERSAGRVDEALLNAINVSLDDFKRHLDRVIEIQEYQGTQLKEENNVLRSIAGLSENEMKAKLVEQGEEIRFLREQLLRFRKEYDSIKSQNTEVSAVAEQERLEISKINRMMESEQKKNLDEMERIKNQTAGFKDQLDSQQGAIDREKARLEAEHETFKKGYKRDVEKDIIQEIRSLGARLRNLSGPIAGSSQFCLEKLQKIKSGAGKPLNEFFVHRIAGKFIKSPQEIVLELAPDLDVMQRNSHELVQLLDIYLKLYEEPKLKYEKINFLDFWNELNGKYMTQMLKLNAKLKWPQETKYPSYFTDRKVLADICGILVMNALESLQPGGMLEVSVLFSSEGLDLLFSDNGAGVKPDDRDKIFIPFFSTKPGRLGIGLPLARRLAEYLEGSLEYEPRDKGSLFKLSIPGRKETK